MSLNSLLININSVCEQIAERDNFELKNGGYVKKNNTWEYVKGNGSYEKKDGEWQWKLKNNISTNLKK